MFYSSAAANKSQLLVPLRSITKMSNAMDEKHTYFVVRSSLRIQNISLVQTSDF